MSLSQHSAKALKRPLFLIPSLLICLFCTPFSSPAEENQTAPGWEKYSENPVLGGKEFGPCFDVSVMLENAKFKMWFSWRNKASIGYVESSDGLHWDSPRIVLGPEKSGWEDAVNRPYVLKKSGQYHMWYTGQANNTSNIGYARSDDGIQWKRVADTPVLIPQEAWEGVAIMTPSVIWDKAKKLYRMWYSAGENYEPDSIGYAESADGIVWNKWKKPVFTRAASGWDSWKVTAPHVIPYKGAFYMFYIGFSYAPQIGLARSQDGINGWERFPGNPIIRKGSPGSWDADAAYKPFVLFVDGKWMLWYNGSAKGVEQIGVALRDTPELFE